MPECPACGSTATRKRRAPLRTCQTCGHTYAPDLHVAALEELYNEDYHGFHEDPRLTESLGRVVRDDLARLAQPPARILDVGCGNGQFLRIATQHGYIAEGIDVSAAGVKIATEQGLNATVARIEDHQGGPYDLVTMWDVIEHIPDPVAFLSHAHRLGGHVVIKTPLQGERAIRLVGVAPRLGPAIMKLPGHVQFFTPTSLTSALSAAGFADSQISVIGGMRRAVYGTLARRARRATRQAVVKAVGGGNLLATARH